jgi:small-conductance mechanosensitive channel
LILLLLTLSAALPFVPLPARIVGPSRHAIGLCLIAALAWLAVAMIDLLAELINVRHAANLSNNLGARRIRTQVQVLRHTMVAVVTILGVSTGLMTFPNIRHVGESLFASAGLAALVAGLAAHSTLSSLLAGMQIA